MTLVEIQRLFHFRLTLGSFLVAASCILGACAREGPTSDDATQDLAAVRGTLDAWVGHMEGGQYDSLATLLTPDFAFLREGKRQSYGDLVSLIRAYQIKELDIRLSNVSVHTSGDLGYIVYDDEESFKAGGTAAMATETGLIVLRRHPEGWRIAVWAVSPPPAPTPPPTK